MVIPPTIAAFGPIHTLFPIVGTPFLEPRTVEPIVTPVNILQLLPILTLGAIITLPK